MKIKNIINEVINEFMTNEVRYVDTNYVNKKDIDSASQQEPIKNNETIRVFHGTSIENALKFAINGLSGQDVVPRNYSYEMKMNPNGLFVTTNFNTAKNFAFDNKTMTILEFTVRASDLDTPVWNGQSSYFGQFSNPQPFSNKGERDKQWKNYQDIAKKSEQDYVRNSDNPAMANNIFNNSEHQALFLGNLNPNQIKRIWVKDVNDTDRIFKPMKRVDFIKKYGNTEPKKNKKEKLYNPNDDYQGLDDFVNRIWEDESEVFKRMHEKKGDVDKHKQDIKNNLEYYLNEAPHIIASTIKAHMYPKQIIQMMGKEYFEEYFNNVY